MATVSTLVVALVAQTSEFERGLKSVEKSLDRTARQVGTLGKELSAGITAPMAALATGALHMALKFEESFDRMATLAGRPENEIEKLKRSVLSLSTETATAPEALASALTKIQNAGLHGAASVEVMRAAAKGAKIGLGELATITDTLTAAINAYGPGVISAADATGVLIEAVRGGRVSGEELASSMSGLLPLASQIGVSFSDVAAAMTTMTRGGMGAGNSAMALKSILSALLKPSAAAQKALLDIGVNSDDLKRKLASGGLLPVLETLQKAFERNGAAIEKVFPNMKALGGTLALLGSNAKEAEDTFRRLAGATGETLSKAFAKLNDDVGFKFEKAMREVNVLLIRLGDEILPAVVPFVRLFGDVVEKLTARIGEMTKGQKDLVIVLAASAAVMGPLLMGFSLFYSGVSTALSALRLLLPVVAALVSPVLALASGIAALVGAFLTGLSISTFAVFVKTFGLWITTVELVIPSIVAKVTAAGSAVVAFFAGLSAPVIIAATLMATAATLIIARWKLLGESIGVIVDWVVEKIRDSFVGRIVAYLESLVEKIASFLRPVLPMFAALWKVAAMPLGLDRVSDLGLAWTGVTGSLKSALSGVKDLASATKEKIGGEMSEIMDGIISKAEAMASKIMDSARSIGGAAGAAEAPASAITPTTPAGGAPPLDVSAWAKFRAKISAASDGVESDLKGLGASFRSTQEQISASARSMSDATASSMGAMTAAFAQGRMNIGEFVKGMIQSIMELVAKIMILRAIAAAGIGGPFAGAFVGGLKFFAEGGRPPLGQASVVGERGPELFVPDTSGTIVPISSSGSGAQVNISQSITVEGLDLSSPQAARQILKSLKDEVKRSTQDAVQFAVRSANLAGAHSGVAA